MQILDGKVCSDFYRAQVSETVKKIIALNEKPPRLSVFLVGDNQSSAMYIRMKEKACRETGIETRTHVLSEETSEADIIELIKKENADSQTSGILVQLPLPKKYNETRILSNIEAAKDADCFLPENIGHMFLGNKETVISCTPLGVMKLLNYYKIDVAGKDVCIIGRSNIVGKPLALLMLAANATVTICHSKTKNLPEVAKRADILVAAIGRARMIDETYVKPGAVVVDVGINHVEVGNGKSETCGDCDFEKISKVAGAITPVPKGVGPMTIAMVLYNTVYNYILMKKLDIKMDIGPKF
ncbi:MAG TPA: bifunctional 5,10-methylenetetrahydrofolate dehydrogenase/5,10-methenyltetrahydrofolate cyclohydrolase [Candidatus Wallbacteria bacterium]|nr:bifunctional 5,10-methylenetetrahydrofolate dehydrogenase/5,10-methenyltetrahydrofolate cyclohydrolase [Candidatus Wallbacteria bacterium]